MVESTEPLPVEEELEPVEPELMRVGVRVHGRVLFRPGAAGQPLPMLIGFHGYAENALDQLKRLLALDSSRGCLLVVPQALHPFYTRSNGEVVASWLTRLDRDESLAENLRYVAGVLEKAGQRFEGCPARVFCGFSQGAAMAFRAAVRHCDVPAFVIALGAEIPQELDSRSLSRLSGVLLGRGSRDRHYPAEKLDADMARLHGAGLSPECAVLDAAHLWTADFSRKAADFLGRIIPTA